MVEEKEIKRLVYGSGYARSKDYVLLKAEVSGYIKEVLVEEGDYVKRGAGACPYGQWPTGRKHKRSL